MPNVLYSGDLTAASIDGISEKIAEVLGSNDVDVKYIVRTRLSVEEALGIWAEELGEQTSCRILQSKRFGKTELILRANGIAVDPTKFQDDLLLSMSGNINLMTALQLPVAYNYSGGRNELRIKLPSEDGGSVKKFIIAIILATAAGMGLRLLAPDLALTVSENLATPVMDTFLNVLNTIAGPLVLLSIITGIIGVGDASEFGKIGGTLVRRIIIMSLISATLVWLSLLAFFPVTLQGSESAGGAYSGIMQMLLDIVPHDIITPFQTGNALQIIFIAISLGVICIILGSTVSDVANILNQLNSMVQKAMEMFSRLLPVLVFVCILNLIISSDITALSQIFIPLLIVAVSTITLSIVYALYTSISAHIPFGELVRKLLPTFIIAMTTASSAAAFSSNVDCCKNDLKIDDKLVNFGVPFGQVLFMPGSVAEFVIVALFMSKQYGIMITPQWVIKMILVATILAIATPPIPGGEIPSILIFFSQLGIPLAGVGVCTTILAFGDFFTTSSSVTCLQQELLLTAKKLGMRKKDQ